MKQKIAKPKKYRQNKVDMHFHPRRLARSVVHSMLNMAGATGVNKTVPGATQSPFAQHWRYDAEDFAK